MLSELVEIKEGVVQYLRECADICEETPRTEDPKWNNSSVRTYRKSADFIEQEVRPEDLLSAFLAVQALREHLKAHPEQFLEWRPRLSPLAVTAGMYCAKKKLGYEPPKGVGAWLLNSLEAHPGQH